MKLNAIPIALFPLFPSLNLDIDNAEDIPVIFEILADHTNIFLFLFIFFQIKHAL